MLLSCNHEWPGKDSSMVVIWYRVGGCELLLLHLTVVLRPLCFHMFLRKCSCQAVWITRNGSIDILDWNYHWLSHFCVLYLDTNNHYTYNTQSNDWCSSWLFDKDIMCWYQTMKENLRYKSDIFANLFVRTRSWVHDTVTLVTGNIIFRVVEFSHLVTILFFPSEHCIPTTDLC